MGSRTGARDRRCLRRLGHIEPTVGEGAQAHGDAQRRRPAHRWVVAGSSHEPLGEAVQSHELERRVLASLRGDEEGQCDAEAAQRVQRVTTNAPAL